MTPIIIDFFFFNKSISITKVSQVLFNFHFTHYIKTDMTYWTYIGKNSLYFLQQKLRNIPPNDLNRNY